MTQMRIGLREANQHFSALTRVVKAGKEVILTERGKPIAVLKPLAGRDDEAAIVRRLEATGFLRAAKKPGPMPAWAPRPLRGTSLTSTIRAERDAS
jgi:prevent-host-death family protein